MNTAPPPYNSAYTRPTSGYGPSDMSTSYPSYNASPMSTTSSNPGGDRGLGGLIVGLGAAAMLNNAMNSNHPQTAPMGVATGNGREDPLAILARFDTILLIDDSASMASGDLWREAAGAVSAMAETLVKYDAGELPAIARISDRLQRARNLLLLARY